MKKRKKRKNGGMNTAQKKRDNSCANRHTTRKHMNMSTPHEKVRNEFSEYQRPSLLRSSDEFNQYALEY